MPLAERIKGLEKVTVGKVLGTPDGSPAGEHYAFLTELSWPVERAPIE